MAIGESRVLYGDKCIVHGRFNNNEEVNKANDVILGFELLFGSHGSSDSSSLFSSDAPSKDFIEKDVKNVGSILSKPAPHLQMMEQDERIPKSSFIATESVDLVEWSVDSNESLFSIHHSTNSFGGDQTLLFASNRCTRDKPTIPSSLPFSSSLTSDREVKISEDKIKQYGGNKDTSKPTAKQTNPSHRSNESDSSSYSFAFPILVPGLQQNDASISGVNTQHSRVEGHMDGESSISRPSPTPPLQRKHRWCCCFPFRSCCKPRR